MFKLNLTFPNRKMETEYHLLEKVSRVEAFKATLCFWLVFLVSFTITSIINKEFLATGVFLGMTCILIIFLYYQYRFKKDCPYVKLLITVLLCLSALCFAVVNMSTGSKSLVFLRGWSYASVQIMLVNQFTRLRDKLISVIVSFGLRFGVMGYFDIEVFSVDVVMRHILYDAFVIYIFYTFERKERKIFESFYAEREELLKFKDLLDNCLPQSITIINSKNQKPLFSNKAFLNSIGKLPSQPESKNDINSSQLHSSFVTHLITSPLHPLLVEKHSLKSVGASQSQLFSSPEVTTSLEDFLQEIVDRGFFGSHALSFSASCLKQTEKSFYNVTVMPVTWDKVLATAVIFNDVTDQQNLNELRVVDSNKDLVLATVAHELRTPLNGIIGVLQVTEPKVKEPEALEYISLCKDNANLLLSLVNSILDLQQIQHGKLKLNPVSTKIRKVMNDTIRLFKFAASEKRLYIDLDIDKNVPEYIKTDENRFKQILINLIGNALKFTLNGGIKVKVSEDPTDGRQLKISIADTGIGIKEECKAKLFKIYSRVEDGEKVNKNGVGLGLSISDKLAKLIGQNKGDKGIEVESRFGFGSKFWFRILKDVERKPHIEQEEKQKAKFSYIGTDEKEELLALQSNILGDCEESTRPFNIGSKLSTYSPMRKVSMKMYDFSLRTMSQKKTLDIKDDEGVREKGILSSSMDTGFKEGHLYHQTSIGFGEKGEAFVEGSKGCVLIVDDNPFNLLIARTLIEGFDYTVETAMTGQEAIDKVQMTSKDGNYYLAIIMDCQMPIMDGYETTEILKEMMNRNEILDTPIIALTANHGLGDRQRCLSLGMIEYLTKPLSGEDFLKIISKLNKQNPKDL